LISINLLPKTLRKRVEPGWWRLIAIAIPVVVLGVILGLQLGLNNQISGLTSQRDQLDTEVKALQKYVDGNTALIAQQKELEVTTAIKAQLDQARVKWSEQIGTFVRKIPASTTRPNSPAVSLKSLTVKHLNPAESQSKAATGAYDKKIISTEFTLTGEAESYADITKYITAFEQDPKFGIEFGGSTRSATTTASGEGGSTNSGGTETARYSFNATVGVVSDTPIAPPATTPGTTTPATTPGTTPGATQPAPTGGSNAR
jgi:type IV pilus assembly protein PilN